MLNEIATKRIQKELMDLERDPPPGITCYPKDDTITDLEAYIKGPPDSPYESGLFKLSIQIPDRYPFQPPQMKFMTSIYHPNIDDTGRICADILKMGDKGEWKPAINLSTALTSLRQLLAAPNPDDPLNVDIAREYQLDYPTFFKNAQNSTTKYASEDIVMNDENDQSENDNLSVSESKNEDKKEEEEEDDKEEEEMKRPKMSLSLSKKKSNTPQQDSLIAPPKNVEHKIQLKVEVTQTIKPKKIETKTKIEKIKKPIDNTVNNHNIKPESLKRQADNLINIHNNKKAKTIVNYSHPPKETNAYLFDEQERKPLDSKFFDENVIILSDDDDIEYDKPIVHSLQLSKKINRNKLSLSKRRHT